MKNRSIQDSDDEENNKKVGFVKVLEQIQYDEPLYIVIFQKIDMLKRQQENKTQYAHKCENIKWK